MPLKNLNSSVSNGLNKYGLYDLQELNTQEVYF